jgi:selenide,water dikinase
MKRLLLVGGGHSHLEVMHELRRSPLRNVDVVLLSPEPTAAYTGMVPGMVAGEYPPTALSFDLPALAHAAGARFIRTCVDAVDGPRRTLTAGGEQMTFDACSINVGSSAAGLDVDGASAHAMGLRPLTNASALVRRLDALIADTSPDSPVPVVTVGGGAAGVEMAIALALRGAGRAAVTLVHGGPTLLESSSPRAQRLARLACERAGVRLQLGERVVQALANAVLLKSGISVPSALTAWLAGAAPPALFSAVQLPLTERGFFAVDDTLRSIDSSAVWGAGDCSVMVAYPWVPRAGVYAVREGPTLAHNLRVAVTGIGTPQRYAPQHHFLSVMLSGPDRALFVWRGIAIDAKWPRLLKRRIDLKFMLRHSIQP